jgi:hypothetical protein
MIGRDRPLAAMTIMFPKRLFPAPLIALLFCAAPVRQFYPDAYFPEDRIYQNKPLRFILRFEGNWTLFTDPAELDKATRSFAAALAKSGVELLFVGATTEGMHGTRGMAVNLNEPAMEYAAHIRRINAGDVRNDQGLTEFIAGRNSMVKWVYDKAEFRFAEFFFAIDTYDIRIAFWSRTDFFENFLPVYESIMSSLEMTGGL